MTNHPRIQNLAVLIVLVFLYLIPALLVPHEIMLDLVSAPLLVFGTYSLILLAQETGENFWEGQRSRAALALYGLFALFLSVIVTRSYGLVTRNLEGTGWLAESHIYSAALYIQFVGLWMFNKSAASPPIGPKKSGLGQLIAGVILGAIIVSSRLLEPVLALIGKVFSRVF